MYGTSLCYHNYGVITVAVKLGLTYLLFSLGYYHHHTILCYCTVLYSTPLSFDLNWLPLD